MMTNVKFEKICQMTQMQLKHFLVNELKKTHSYIVEDDGFVYAKGNFPVLLVAHLDTVHNRLPFPVAYCGDTISSPNGIGGDDRCGVYMILEIISKYNCSVVFCEDEEIGLVGAGKFIESKYSEDLKFNYIMEFDRANAKDAVFYECANDDFEDFITKEFYKKQYGSCSDISRIAPALGCAAVNLSCGYYKAHTKQEYVNLQEMETSIQEACKILERTTEKDVFEYVEDEFVNGFYGKDFGYGNNFNYGKDDIEYYWLIGYESQTGEEEWYETFAVSEEEAVGMFLIDNPTLTYNHIIAVFEDGMVM